VLREKIFHFDHERIPERIVHARGSARTAISSCTEESRPHQGRSVPARRREDAGVHALLHRRRRRRLGRHAARRARLRGEVLYQEGNWDLVGNNIPVFFIQDAIKFPDLIHAVKMEADRAYPQAGSAHDTFWDWASLMPETTHMLMWAMSDRAIPRSLRMMEGFGVHTFQLVNAKGKVTFVKFHWKPKLGTAVDLWDEALKLAGADNDYHRRDLHEAIASRRLPEWELGIQLFDQKFADAQPFDVLDATKLIPEEVMPVRLVGRMVLDRNPDNFFAETEQVAFCPANIVPGDRFLGRPAAAGAAVQLSRHAEVAAGHGQFPPDADQRAEMPVDELPARRPDADERAQGPGQLRAEQPGRAGEDGGPRECPETGFRTAAGRAENDEQGGKLRVRAELFADHYSQARLFWRSQTESEQAHVASSFVFELSKVERWTRSGQRWWPTCATSMRNWQRAWRRARHKDCRPKPRRRVAPIDMPPQRCPLHPEEYEGDDRGPYHRHPDRRRFGWRRNPEASKPSRPQAAGRSWSRRRSAVSSCADGSTDSRPMGSWPARLRRSSTPWRSCSRRRAAKRCSSRPRPSSSSWTRSATSRRSAPPKRPRGCSTRRG
jgi:catalase